MADIVEFIVKDVVECGLCRLTHVPSGETLVAESVYDGIEWDAAQVKWLRKFDAGVVVYDCGRVTYQYSDSDPYIPWIHFESVELFTNDLSAKVDAAVLKGLGDVLGSVCDKFGYDLKIIDGVNWLVKKDGVS
jgi:hypothetical protein